MKKIACLLLLLILPGCGFLDKPRLCEDYFDWAVRDSDKVILLTTWPIHAVVLAGCATVDQGCRTVESVPPAAVDAWDYLVMPVSDDNVMLRQTILVPKLLATPLIFVGSYAVRWLIPIPDDERPFEFEGD